MTTGLIENPPVYSYDYKVLLDASPDGVLVLDNNGHIHYTNEGVRHILGFTSSELTGIDIRTLLCNKESICHIRNIPECGDSDLSETELDIKASDGKTVTVWAKIVSICGQENNGNTPFSLLYIRDVTERKRLEHVKEESMGIISHELRSHLTIIIGALHTVLSEQDRLSSADIRQLIEDATIESEALFHTLVNLLELSREQKEPLLLYREYTNMQKVVCNAIDSVRRQSNSHNIIVDIPDDLPDIIADEIRLERILFNLLDNAIKYSTEGGDITVSANLYKDYVVISVSDQGIGISRKDQLNIFKPFYRSRKSIKNGLRGTGLGLLVCQRLVEAHGGRIWVESQPGIGSTFYFTLNKRK